jgi:hypothetical protein
MKKRPERAVLLGACAAAGPQSINYFFLAGAAAFLVGAAFFATGLAAGFAAGLAAALEALAAGFATTALSAFRWRSGRDSNPRPPA